MPYALFIMGAKRSAKAKFVGILVGLLIIVLLLFLAAVLKCEMAPPAY